MAAADAPASREQLLKETQTKFAKRFRDTPMCKDLPRLASRISVRSDAGLPDGYADEQRAQAEGFNLLAPVTLVPVYVAMRCLAAGLGEARCGAQLAAEFATQMATVSPGAERDAIGALCDSLGGDDCRVVRLLKTCTQGFVAPVAIDMRMRLGMAHMLSDVPGTWQIGIEISHADVGCVRVTHSRAESGPAFSLSWYMVARFPVTLEVGPFALDVLIDRLTVAGMGASSRHVSQALGSYFGGEARFACEREVVRATNVVTLVGCGADALPVDLCRMTDEETGAVHSLLLDCNQLTARALSVEPSLARFAPFGALRVLSLASNPLGTVPECIWALVSLVELSLGGAELVELSPRIAELRALVRLSLSYNRLKSLPMELSGMASLRTLHLSNNALAYIPTDLARLPQLELLTIHNNPGVPAALQEASLAQVLEFLASY